MKYLFELDEYCNTTTNKCYSLKLSGRKRLIKLTFAILSDRMDNKNLIRVYKTYIFILLFYINKCFMLIQDNNETLSNNTFYLF